MTPAGTAMTQTAQNPPFVLRKNTPFLAFSERSGRLWPFSRHVMDDPFVDGFWSGAELTLPSVWTRFSGKIYLCGETAAISGLTHSCFRRDRLAQFGSASGSSPRRCDSHKHSAARAVHHTNKRSQWNFILQGIRDWDHSWKYCYTRVPPATFRLFPAMLASLCSLWVQYSPSGKTTAGVSAHQIPPRHHQVSTGDINPSIGHKDPLTITLPGFKH